MQFPPETRSGRTGSWRTNDSGFLDWAASVAAGYDQVLAPHHRLLLLELNALCEGSIDRLLVLMPPGSAKSSYTSILFPIWWLGQHPTSAIIAASHTASLAHRFARQVRQVAQGHGGKLGVQVETGTRASLEWRTKSGGEYFCCGIRGPITGRRADLAIIDDPVKSQAEANNPGVRDHLWNWFRQDLTTRLKPGGRIVLIMTRWHEDDIAGRLLEQTEDHWRCLNLPALASAQDPLGREEGSAIWPEWESEEQLERKRTSVGERAWLAAYQQEPRPIGAGLFQIAHIGTCDATLAKKGPAIRAWDLAATSATENSGADWTVGLKLTRGESGGFVIEDIVREQASAIDVEQILLRTARLDGPEVVIALPKDPGQSGKSQAGYLIKALAGYTVLSSPETGSKESRALPVASQVAGGNFAVVRGTWNYAFLDELREFPFGRKDDQVDALSRAFLTLAGVPAPARQAFVPFIPR